MSIDELLEKYAKKHDDWRLFAETGMQSIAPEFGGMENLLRYLLMTDKTMTEITKSFNLTIPKGAIW